MLRLAHLAGCHIIWQLHFQLNIRFDVITMNDFTNEVNGYRDVSWNDETRTIIKFHKKAI